MDDRNELIRKLEDHDFEIFRLKSRLSILQMFYDSAAQDIAALRSENSRLRAIVRRDSVSKLDDVPF